MRNTVQNSLEVINEEPFVGSVTLPNAEEIKQRVFGFYATQNRAVTTEDYRAMAYAMPGKFGAVKRAAVVRDFDEFKRNLNLYIVSENNSGKLVAPNSTLKNNLRNWILQYKMVNDTVDILDASIINFTIEYSIVADMNTNRFTVINRANNALREFLANNPYEIGQSIMLTDFYKALQKVDGIVDVEHLEVKSITGAQYSDTSYDFVGNLAATGRSVQIPNNAVVELKFPNVDIKGSVR